MSVTVSRDETWSSQKYSIIRKTMKAALTLCKVFCEIILSSSLLAQLAIDSCIFKRVRRWITRQAQSITLMIIQ